MTFADILNISQQIHAKRHQLTGISTELGSPLGAWGSQHAAISTTLNMLQGAFSAIPITTDCPESELL